MPPSPEAGAASSGQGGYYTGYGAPSGGQQPPAQSYTQSLLARFSLPATRWSGGGEAGAASGADFYSFLASAVSAAANAAASSSRTAPTRESETLIPANIRGTSARMSFIAAQRERLSYVLSALDREASQLQTESEDAANRASSSSSDGQGGPGIKTRSLSGHSAGSESASGASGLSKSRSEADFEKLEAESGAEEDLGTLGGTSQGGLRRRGGGAGGQEGSSGGWMSWGWGGGSGGGGDTAGGDRSTPTPGQE